MPILRKRTEETVNEIKQAVDADVDTSDFSFTTRKIEVDSVVSTGSTLLDLAISGKRKRGGGVPGGLLMEIFGKSQSGKTAIMAEILASTQSKGGAISTEDPEGRIDKEYMRIYGVEIERKYYSRPDTVDQIFKNAHDWEPHPRVPKAINTRGTDSLAALTTELEMSDKGDKMGQRRAKEFSAGFRKTARLIVNNNWLWVCTNQVRQGDYGDVVPGGLATAFYASIRIRLRQVDEIKKTIKLNLSGKAEPTNDDEILEGKDKKKKSKNEVTKITGIESDAYVIKSVDDPYRSAPLYIMFGYGIDDIRGNLQYIKDMTNNTVYECPDGKTYQNMQQACIWTERENLITKLQEQTIDIWEVIESKFDLHRAKKVR